MLLQLIVIFGFYRVEIKRPVACFDIYNHLSSCRHAHDHIRTLRTIICMAVWACSIKSQCSTMPESSASRLSVISPHWPRTSGRLNACTRFLVSLCKSLLSLHQHFQMFTQSTLCFPCVHFQPVLDVTQYSF